MKYIGFGLLAIILLGGCSRYVGSVPLQTEQDEVNDTKPTGSLYQYVSGGKHKLRQEPFSAASHKRDPELLGPQRTISNAVGAEKTVTVSRVKKNKMGMTKKECVAMVGQEKFDIYSKKFGGDAGVLKRCTIIKKLKRR